MSGLLRATSSTQQDSTSTEDMRIEATVKYFFLKMAVLVQFYRTIRLHFKVTLKKRNS